MINRTRSAEYGGKIINDTDLHTFDRSEGQWVISLKVLETTVINAITSFDYLPVENLATYYDGKTIYAGDTIDANIASVKLTSGAVQAYYRA